MFVPKKLIEEDCIAFENREDVDAQAFIYEIDDKSRKILREDAISEHFLKISSGKFYSAQIYRRSKFFFYYRDDIFVKGALCWTTTLDEEPNAIIDPVVLYPGENWELVFWNFSDCERYLAFTVSLNGSDTELLHIYDFERGLVTERLNGLRFASVAWDPDSSGFLYNRYFPPQKTGDKGGYGIFHHVLGCDQCGDTLVQDWRHTPEAIPEPIRSFRSPVCFVYATIGANGQNYLAWRPSGTTRVFDVIQNFGLASTLPFKTTWRDGCIEALFITDLNHNNGVVASLQLSEGGESKIEKMRVVVAERDNEVLAFAVASDHHIFCVFNTGTSHRLRIVDRKTLSNWEVPLPEFIDLQVFLEHPKALQLHVILSSVVDHRSLLVVDPFSQSVRTCRGSRENTFSVTNLVESVMCDDGVFVPISLSFKEGLNVKHAPLLLYVYGGFGVPSTPVFDPIVQNWIEQNGIFATAHVRGGGEYGEIWHKAGMGKKKQRAISDLIACAEHLSKNGFCRPESIILHGQSHGGFLVAATLNQRRNLFAAAIIEVPVTDLVRYETDSAGLAWKDEFGSIHVSDERAGVLAISPLHNITDQAYPPILVIGSDHDDRVATWHSTKYVAKLTAISPETDVYLLMRKNSGHQTSGSNEEAKLMLSFLERHRFISASV